MTIAVQVLGAMVDQILPFDDATFPLIRDALFVLASKVRFILQLVTYLIYVCTQQSTAKHFHSKHMCQQSIVLLHTQNHTQITKQSMYSTAFIYHYKHRDQNLQTKQLLCPFQQCTCNVCCREVTILYMYIYCTFSIVELHVLYKFRICLCTLQDIKLSSFQSEAVEEFEDEGDMMGAAVAAARNKLISQVMIVNCLFIHTHA